MLVSGSDINAMLDRLLYGGDRRPAWSGERSHLENLALRFGLVSIEHDFSVWQITPRGKRARKVAAYRGLWDLEKGRMDFRETSKTFRSWIERGLIEKTWAENVMALKDKRFRRIQEDLLLQIMSRNLITNQDGSQAYRLL